MVLALAALGSTSSRGEEPTTGALMDVRRALAMVGPSASEEPALRRERQAREPSPGFLLGAALGAWINATAQLDFDRDHPTAAGPPHVSQSGADPDALAQDCAEEQLAFVHLQSRAADIGASVDQVAAAGPINRDLVARWRMRTAAPPPVCR